MAKKRKTKKKTSSSWKDYVSFAVSGGGGSDKIPLDQAKDMLNGFLQWAGKSKDEVLQLMASEAATAFANTLKEPLVQILKSKNVTIEIKLEDKAASKAKPKRASKRTAK